MVGFGGMVLFKARLKGRGRVYIVVIDVTTNNIHVHNKCIVSKINLNVST